MKNKNSNPITSSEAIEPPPKSYSPNTKPDKKIAISLRAFIARLRILQNISAFIQRGEHSSNMRIFCTIRMFTRRMNQTVNSGWMRAVL